MSISERSQEYYEEEYNNKKRSIHDIAEEWGTYPNRIRRELLSYGYKTRDKSEAQTLAIKSGRHKHPTRGVKRSQETKERIGQSVYDTWASTDAHEKLRRIEVGKKQWKEMTDEDKEIFRKNGGDAVRLTTKEGSKLEKYLVKNLKELGYEVEFHRDGLIYNEKLQIDIFVPELKVAIEIDGPSHFLPIWGQENFERTVLTDTKKNTLLVTHGYVVLRVKNVLKTLSDVHLRDFLSKIKLALENIRDKFPDVSDRIIEIS